MYNLLNLINEKKIFVIQTFANLLIQLAITYWVAFKSSLGASYQYGVFLVSALIIAQFAIIFSLHETKNLGIQFALFSVFSVIAGMLLNTFKDRNYKIIHSIIQVISLVFAVMFALGVVLLLGGILFGKTTLLIMLALIVLYIILGIFGGFKSLKTYGFLLFAAFIAVDTNMMLQEGYDKTHTPINASMRYYLDILNLYRILRRGKK
jgi:hypothetical protein